MQPTGQPPSCSSGTPACADGSQPSGPGAGAGAGGGAGAGAGAGAAASSTVASTGCTSTDGAACAKDGSAAYTESSGLTYSSSTGKFSGTLKGNQCPSHTHYGQPTATCSTVSFPVSGYETGPKVAPLRGAVGYTRYLGHIYGPFEAGFGGGMPEACNTAGVATCKGGMDVPNCEAKLRYECEAAGSTVKVPMLLDDCGGHATPYHYHVAMRCMYPQSDSSAHSPLLGIALDGHGIYGVWEGSGAFPSVDACNGHLGPVPSDSGLSVTVGSVYHYHMTPYSPFTLGCFGPVTSIAACKSLYTTCGDGDAITFTGKNAAGSTFQITGYDLDCPCIQQKTAYQTASLSMIDEAYQNLVSDDPFDTGAPTAAPMSGAPGKASGTGPGPTPAPSSNTTSTALTTSLAPCLLAAALAFSNTL